MLIETAEAESEGSEDGESGDYMEGPDGEGKEPGNREPEKQTTGQGDREPGERTEGQRAGRLVEPVEIRIGENEGNPS